MPFTTPARAARAAVRAGRHRDVPAQAAARRGGRAVDAAVDPAGDRRRGERTVAAAASEPAAAPPAAARDRARAARRAAVPRAAGRAGPRHRPRRWTPRRAWRATDVVPEPARPPRKQVAIDALRDLPTGGKVSVIAADRSARIVVNEHERPRRASARRSRRSRVDRRAAATSATRSSWPRSSRRARATPRSSSRPTRRSRSQPTAKVDGADQGPAGRRASARTRRSSRSRCGRRRRRVTRSVFISVANLDLERAHAPDRAVGRRPPARGARRRRSTPQARSDVIIDDVPTRASATVEVRLVGARLRRRRRARPARRRRPRVGGRPARPRRGSCWSSARATRTSRPRSRTSRTSSCTASTPAEYGPATERTDGRPWDLDHLRGQPAGDAARRRRSWRSRRRGPARSAT